jgi:hypothetical protein
VLRQGRDLVAVEVRSSPRVFEADMRVLRAMAGLSGVKRRILVFRGDRKQKTADGVEILPVASFLTELEGSALFP